MLIRTVLLKKSQMYCIQVVSDNIYTQEIIKELIPKLRNRTRLDMKVAVFLFEQKWPNEKDIYKLIHCNAGDILILAQPELCEFIKVIVWKKNIAFGPYGAGTEDIMNSIKQFLNPASHNAVCRDWKEKRPVSFSLIERQVISLYLKGLPLTSVSKIMGRNYKTLSTHKRKVMSKLGIDRDAGLIKMERVYSAILSEH